MLERHSLTVLGQAAKCKALCANFQKCHGGTATAEHGNHEHDDVFGAPGTSGHEGLSATHDHANGMCDQFVPIAGAGDMGQLDLD